MGIMELRNRTVPDREHRPEYVRLLLLHVPKGNIFLLLLVDECFHVRYRQFSVQIILFAIAIRKYHLERINNYNLMNVRIRNHRA